jgi:hypothetical protein
MQPHSFSSWMASLPSNPPVRISLEQDGGIDAATAALLGASISAIAALLAIAMSNWHQRRLAEDQREHDWSVRVSERYYRDLQRAVELLQLQLAENERDYHLAVRTNGARNAIRTRYRTRIFGELQAVLARCAVHRHGLLMAAMRATLDFVETVQATDPNAPAIENAATITKAVEAASAAVGALEVDLIFQLAELEEFPPKLRYRAQLEEFLATRESSRGAIEGEESSA